MSIGHGMIWPLAAEYARRGWAVRRAGWTNEITHPFSKSSSLRWIHYDTGMFHVSYLDRSSTNTFGNVRRVIRNTDFGVDEFYANDWTVYAPSCYAIPEQEQQGKLDYPGAAEDEPYPDPNAPAPSGTGCPKVPPIFDDLLPSCSEPCQQPLACGTNFKSVTGGYDSCGCRVQLCQPIFCPDPPICPPGFTPRSDGFNDLGCAVWRCSEDDRQPCGDSPVCDPNSKL
ncbi:MAG: hypothetical protein ACO3RV_07270, partial [Luteolibacter sp.]